MRLLAALAFGIALFGIALLGCGGDDAGTEKPETSTTAATSSAPSTTASAPMTPAAPATDATGASAPASGAPPRTVALSRFQTPTGNIACYAAEDGIRCDIRERSWTPPPKPASCDLDWGNGLGIGDDGSPSVVCAGDTVIDDALPKLGYGEASRVGPVTCTSRLDGLTCTHDRTGRGFFLSRQAYRLF